LAFRQSRPELKKYPEELSLRVMVESRSEAWEPAAADCPGPMLALPPRFWSPAEAR
jgi:hypothetical protein